ncbi:STAS domain-containing protein [Sorangium sp. So ce1151]|uniref:STAS domain-containing protein n=1 Tax=Sorangium sp. So ce1151 TaxID=3133332 RepID=UPI003F6392E8
MKPVRRNEGKTRLPQSSPQPDEINKQEQTTTRRAGGRKAGKGTRASSAELARTVEHLENRVRAQQAILDNIVDGVVVGNRNGTIMYSNQAAEAVLKVAISDAPPEEWSTRYGLYHADGKTPFPSSELPLARALQGEVITAQEIFFRNDENPQGSWLLASARPLLDADGTFFGAVAVFRDIGDRKRWEQEMEQQLVREKERNDALERLRLTVQQLSTPILEVWDDVLVLPIIGVLDSRRSGEMTDQLLEEIARKQSRFVIVDVTGVEIVDSSTADQLLRLVSSVELLGARCMLTGVRPAVAQTLTSLRVDLGPMLTLRNLRHGLQTCLRMMHADMDMTRAIASRSGITARR